jgi:Protein of unknown function (DUF3891)
MQHGGVTFTAVLLRADEEGVIAIGQLSHAWLSGQLARAWGNDRFPAPAPRADVCLGAEQHDVGWAEFDRRPKFNPETGLPQTFLEGTIEQHLAIWGDAPDRLTSASECAALVVSLHGSFLSGLRLRAAGGKEPSLEEHIDKENRRQAHLRARLGLGEEQVTTIQDQMRVWDGLSLALCHRATPFTARDVPESTGKGALDLGPGPDPDSFFVDPWPFSSPAVEVRCEGRRLAPSYESEEALLRAFESATPLTLTFRLLPAGDAAGSRAAGES